MKRRFLLIFSVLILVGLQLFAGRGKHKYAGEPKSEAELMEKVLECFRSKDSMAYFNLFPPFDSMWKMVIHNPDQSPETQNELAQLREHPTVLIDLDPFYNKAIVGNFMKVLHKGEDSGVQWGGVVVQRFELQKQGYTPEMVGLQHVVPERYKGFLFVRDQLSSTTFCLTMLNIQKFGDMFCGGQVLNVLEAKSIDEYMAKEESERRALARQKWLAEHGQPDDTAIVKKNGNKSDTGLFAAGNTPPNADTVVDTAARKKALLLSGAATAEEDSLRTRKEVIDRKYYKGKFDETIPVELYVRYMKDLKGKLTKYWDALYKFGDMSEYVKLDVSMSPEGKWLFEEPVASMELDLVEKKYSGSWTNGQNQTGYDAELVQKELSQKKIEQFDYILDNGVWGKTDQQKIAEKFDSSSTDSTTKGANAAGSGDKEKKPKEKKLTRKQRKQKEKEAQEAEAKRKEEERKKEEAEDNADDEPEKDEKKLDDDNK